MDSCPQIFLDIAHKLADVSEPFIQAAFRQPFDVEAKTDLSPVTIIDRQVEQVMRDLLCALRPDDGLIGEEYGTQDTNAEWVWVLDPIDGTRAFAAGKPVFGTLIALLRGGEPILGLINQPILKERWIGARGHPTMKNGTSCRCRSCPSLAKAIVNLGPQAFPFGNAVSLDPYRRVDKAALTSTVGGDCYSYGLLASGYIDLVIEHGLKIYDFAALVPVVEGAGGLLTDWCGGKLTIASEGKVLSCGDSHLHAAAVELLDGAL